MDHAPSAHTRRAAVVPARTVWAVVTLEVVSAASRRAPSPPEKSRGWPIERVDDEAADIELK
jgi:hypothetical protein